MKLQDFDFELDESLIAEYPLENRDESKLLYIPKEGSDPFEERKFKEIISFLKEGDVLVFNDTKVIPAKIEFEIASQNESGNRKAELNLLRKIENKIIDSQEYSEIWEALARPVKKLKKLEKVLIDDELFFSILSSDDQGVITIKFNLEGDELRAKLEQVGMMPIPPYIAKNREITKKDNKTYQTVYAKKEGAVAAPTAGLHFTEEILNQIKAIGVKIVFVTLHVGAGTFLPVRVDDVAEHQMHSEYFEISEESAEVINNAKDSDNRVIAVGTTSLRSLESAANEEGKVQEFLGDTSIFITPGYKFKIVDCLITNFHLPKSTLFMLVSAFAGLKKMKDAYEFARLNKFRFFSYGDSSFLERNDAK